jgi:hypothetical protein
METKICSRCKKEKSLNEFYKDKAHKDGLNNWCIDCWKLKGKKYRQNNVDKLRQIYQLHKEEKSEYNRMYRLKHRDKLIIDSKNYFKTHKNERKIYKQKNKEQINTYFRNRRNTILKCNLIDKMSRGIRNTLKNGKNGKHWETLVGYTCNDLIKRLKTTMPKNYNWQDFLNAKLQIDHIIPIDVFNFNKPEHPDFIKCWALKNLQLLPAKENRIKSNHIEKPFQPALQLSGC